MLKAKETVTSRQNPTVKRICSLLEKKGRRAEGLFRFDGVKLFGEALRQGLRIRYAVLCQEARAEAREAVERALEQGILPEECVLMVSGAVFDKLSEEGSPEGIVTVAEPPKELHRSIGAHGCGEYALPESEKILIAESLRDPGNLGTVIRSCAALGIDRLIVSEDCADLYSPKTVRAAMGGLFRLRIDTVADLPAAILSLKRAGRRVYATALHSKAEQIGEIEPGRGACFVIGNEGHGLSQAVVEACGDTAIIPMAEGSESLNAAAAAAICIWETVRGR